MPGKTTYFVLVLTDKGESLVSFDTQEERGEYADRVSREGAITHYLSMTGTAELSMG